jgi:hypothetical protein
MSWIRHAGPPDYPRNEGRAHQLDRNWAELVQELRVIGTGIQILFAFLLGIAFQARFQETSSFERDVYLATLLASGLAAVLLITPVALHRFLFRFRVKDELVTLTNRVAICGLFALCVAVVGAILLVGTWVGGPVFGWVASAFIAILMCAGWFVAPLVMRYRTQPLASRAQDRQDEGAEGVSERRKRVGRESERNDS